MFFSTTCKDILLSLSVRLCFILGRDQPLFGCEMRMNIFSSLRRKARRRKKKKGKCRLDRLPIPSFVVIWISLWDRQIWIIIISHSHRMGDDRNQLVPGSTGDVNHSLFPTIIWSFLSFVRVHSIIQTCLLFNDLFNPQSFVIIVRHFLFEKMSFLSSNCSCSSEWYLGTGLVIIGWSSYTCITHTTCGSSSISIWTYQYIARRLCRKNLR